MQFNEEAAKEVIQKFALAPNTIKVWRTRGKIPEKYFKEGFEKRKAPDKSGLAQQRKLLELLASDKVNTKGLSQMLGLKTNTLADALMKKQNLSQQQIFAVAKHFKKLRIEIKELVTDIRDKNVVSEKDSERIMAMLKRPDMKLRNVLDLPDPADAQRVYDWRLGKQEISPQLKLQILDRLAIFALELGKLT